MDDSSRSASSVLAELDALRAGDFSYEREGIGGIAGGILGSMISGPHPVAREAYIRALETNAGDPGLFPAIAHLEREVIAMLGDLLSNREARGNLVSGGNEANILALWAARERHGERGKRVIAPVTAHISYEKAARLLGLELVLVPVDASHRVDLGAVRQAIDNRTLALVGVAGSTDLGAVDPIEELGQLALEQGLHLHVDAAFGGFVLPFLAELGRAARPFDFALPGVASITIDPHKMGLSVQPAGAILFRDHFLSQEVRTGISYLAGGKSSQTTLTGTRPGAAICATWAVMKHLGREGYTAVIRNCMQRTDSFLARLKELEGVEAVAAPEMNIVGFRSKEINSTALAQKLRSLGWALGGFEDHLRAVLLPHVTEAHLDQFFPCLEAVLAAARGKQAGGEVIGSAELPGEPDLLKGHG